MKQSIRLTSSTVIYVLGFLMVLSPWLLSADHSFLSKLILQITGFSVIILSLCTNFEMGLFKLIKYRELLITNMIVAFSSLLAVIIINDAEGSQLQLTFILLTFFAQGLPFKIHFTRKRTFEPRLQRG
jgi:hypothetical protein